MRHQGIRPQPGMPIHAGLHQHAQGCTFDFLMSGVDHGTVRLGNEMEKTQQASHRDTFPQSTASP